MRIPTTIIPSPRRWGIKCMKITECIPVSWPMTFQKQWIHRIRYKSKWLEFGWRVQEIHLKCCWGPIPWCHSHSISSTLSRSDCKFDGIDGKQSRVPMVHSVCWVQTARILDIFRVIPVSKSIKIGDHWPCIVDGEDQNKQWHQQIQKELDVKYKGISPSIYIMIWKPNLIRIPLHTLCGPARLFGVAILTLFVHHHFAIRL